MTVRIYHNSDVSAPVLSRAAGSMIAVLDAVLVNGYGSQAPLGWTKEFSGTNIAVYRNSTSIPESTGMYLRVDDTATDYSVVHLYKTMSDINTGTDRIPSLAVTTQDYVRWYKYTANASPPDRKWVIMGDERTFYMNVNHYYGYPQVQQPYVGLYGAGDYNSFVPGNEWNYILFGYDGYSSGTDTQFPYSTNNKAYIGRAAGLVEDTPSAAIAKTINGYPGGNNAYSVSVYDGFVYYMPSLIAETWSSEKFTGTLRGVMWKQTRINPDAWFDNEGKLPGDETGPDRRTLLQRSSSTYSALSVSEDNWDG